MNDRSDPTPLLEHSTERILELARSWPEWDGVPRPSEDGERVYTPHKAIRRHAAT